MTESPDNANVDRRSAQLPEERRAGGADDPHAQAEAILEESAERTEEPDRTRRESTQTPDEPVSQADVSDDS